MKLIDVLFPVDINYFDDRDHARLLEYPFFCQNQFLCRSLISI